MSTYFEGKVCAVTGGAQGLGWALAQALADRGARVFSCDVSTDNLAKREDELPSLSFGERIHLTRCDVAERTDVETWLGHIQRDAGRIDLLINNAAFVRWRDVSDLSLEEE